MAVLGHVLTSLLQERLGKWVSAMISSALCCDLWGVRFSRQREMVQMLTHQRDDWCLHPILMFGAIKEARRDKVIVSAVLLDNRFAPVF